MKNVTIYTDGACSGNPGPGGWGAILKYGEKEKELSGSMVDQIMESAEYKGAQELVTACPLCLYNLNHGGHSHTPIVKYFTEILAEALGIKEEQGGVEGA